MTTTSTFITLDLSDMAEKMYATFKQEMTRDGKRLERCSLAEIQTFYSFVHAIDVCLQSIGSVEQLEDLRDSVHTSIHGIFERMQALQAAAWEAEEEDV